MIITAGDVAVICEKLGGLIGQKPWGVKIGVGSFITFEFGAPTQPTPEGRVHGEWHLWICSTAWRLERNDRPLLGSEDDRVKLDEGIRRLEGKSLQAVEITPYSGDTLFRFQDELNLRLFTYRCQGEDEYWMVFTPGGKVLCIGPGESWSYVDASRSS